MKRDGSPKYYISECARPSANNKRRNHVKNDLDPYVCLTEKCDCPDELYRHSDEWLKHMRKHSLRWRCASKAHSSMFFDTRDDYMSHMKVNHGKSITDEQIAVLADRSLQLAGPLFKSCPLCGIEDQDSKGRLEDHIVGHLRSLALKSLPPIDDGDEETTNVGKREETDHERSTVKNDPDRYITLDFELNFSQPRGFDSDVPGEYSDQFVPDETDDVIWDFIQTKTVTNPDEDSIIRHLFQNQNVMTAEESFQEENSSADKKFTQWELQGTQNR